MVIFGSGSAHIKTAPARNATCDNCKNHGTISFSIYRKHAHVFWIPVFPMNKTGASQCGHCQQVLKPKEMSENLKREYQNFKSDAKGPIWQFSGLVIFIGLIAFAGYSSGKDKENTERYFSEPAVGDIYAYRIESGSYSTMKVMEITPDSIYMTFNDYEIGKSSRIYKIDKEENYTTEFYGVSRQDLNAMNNNGDILDINRD